MVEPSALPPGSGSTPRRSMWHVAWVLLLRLADASRLLTGEGERAVAPLEVHVDHSAEPTCHVRVRPQQWGGGEAELGWVFKYDAETRYTHMGMIESLSNDTLLVAFQAATSLEGGSEQRLQLSRGSIIDGSIFFQPPVPVPTGGEHGAVWGPVLHADEHRNLLWLFYSESRGQCKGGIMDWAPGGDIMLITMNLLTGSWGPPQLVYALEEDQGIPKVTANKLLVLANGDWILPFWRERALLGFGPACRELRGEGSAGVLISEDGGSTWSVHAHLQAPETWLIENTVAELASGELLMLFRTEVGYLYMSRSYDMARSWSAARRVRDLPNPNSKVDMLRLHGLMSFQGEVVGADPLAVIFNDHQHLRTDLRIALSWDDGHTWTRVATIEHAREPGELLHYPTVLQRGCQLIIVYSRFLGRAVRKVTEEQLSEQGIRVAVVSLDSLAVQESFFSDLSAPDELHATGGTAPDRDFKAKLKLMANQQSGASHHARPNWWDRHRSHMGPLW